MHYSLPENIQHDILQLAEKRKIRDLIVFLPADQDGSSPRSPIHLAARGGNVVMFAMDANDPAKVRTLRKIQVVNLDGHLPPETRDAVQKEGVTLLGRL